MERKRVILASDIHLCHIDWYGIPTKERMERFVRDIEAEYNNDPFDALLLLGDYSLDFWKWQIQGSYIKQGVSNTVRFIREYLNKLKKLPIQISMIAGNNEQYGDELWNELTGYERQSYYICGDYLFILLDTYAGDLDPVTHSDGTYTGADVNYINKMMQLFPNKKVILAAHYFEPARESEEFKALLRYEKRIVCLFAGHTHKSDIWTLNEKFGNHKVVFTGQYGESGERPPHKSMWGFREVILTDGQLETNYITPENKITFAGKEILHGYAKQDSLALNT